MPPKVKVIREDIIAAALGLIREGGEENVNARSIATALGCSTQPIFSNFSTMEELLLEVRLFAHNTYLGFIKRELDEGKYPPYKAYGMAYIHFAREESQLFRLLFMCNRAGQESKPTEDFNTSIEMIMKANGFSRSTAELMHLEMWSFVHGIGTMLATSYLLPDDELISSMLTDVYQGLRARHIGGLE